MQKAIANPGGYITDLDAVAAVADDAGLPLIVDNTTATPYLCRPIEHGATLVVHSTTKYMTGNGTVTGGCVVLQRYTLIGTDSSVHVILILRHEGLRVSSYPPR